MNKHNGDKHFFSPEVYVLAGTLRPRFFDQHLVVCVAEPPKCLGPPAPAIVLRTSDGDAGSPPTLEVQ